MLHHLALASLIGAASGIMNKGGVPYEISNPSSGEQKYSTDFERNAGGAVEHFDVYGEVRTRYSQVYWTRNTPINLPDKLIQRFKGKTMAITGYEVDQVVHMGPETGTTTTPDGSILGGFSCYPDCEDTDVSVPIYHAYNHHYFSWLTGTNSEYYRRKVADKLPNPTFTGYRNKKGTPKDLPPSNIVFKENPGGEYRKSFHGYPAGYAQLIHSPNQWVVEPMQIDTHNRNYNITDTEGYQPWFLPTQDSNSTMTNLKSNLSPLIECPCTDRITRSVVNTSAILTQATCKTSISSLSECVAAAVATGATLSSKKGTVVRNAKLPVGCILTPVDKTSNNVYDVIFNTEDSSTAECGSGSDSIGKASPASMLGSSNLGNLTHLTVSHDGETATLTLAGPGGSWFGVGFDATAMKDVPYALIVDGKGKVQERKLANHGPGVVLSPSFNVTSSNLVSGVRTVVITRPVAALTKDHYAIPTIPGKINVITAIGNTVELAYHAKRTGASLTLLPTEVSSCLCAPTTSTYLTYMDSSTQEFNYDCLDAPRSDMKSHGDGTGRNVENRACEMKTYGGGLQCCRHTYFLTDREQNANIPMNKVDKYFLKWRYYFQEYVPATPPTTAISPATIPGLLPAAIAAAAATLPFTKMLQAVHTCNTDADCADYCSFCMNDPSKQPPFICHAPEKGCCDSDADCPESYCMNSPGKSKPFRCHGVLDVSATISAGCNQFGDDKQTCDATKGCEFCTGGWAHTHGCYTNEDAARLPPGMFQCSNTSTSNTVEGHIAISASHKHLHHWVFLIDANINDYEEDSAHYGSKSIGRITANLTVATMGIEDTPDDYKTLSPLVMTPHCHAPSCIREELWNMDTIPPSIICNVSVRYGDEKNGNTSNIFNEANYVAIPPCIWGHQAGLSEPIKLTPETNIMAVKYFNNTFRHFGQMAQWTGLLIYDDGATM